MAMAQERSLEGWAPELGEGLTLAQVIDLAFDYRGNVTVVRADGSEMVGYIFNRDAEASEPYIEMYDEAGDGPFRLLYSEVRNIRFTGKDTATGNSREAWVKRNEKARADR